MILRPPNRLLLGLLVMAIAPAFAADTIKVAVIVGTSGSGALQGEAQTKIFQAAADYINTERKILGGRQLEIVALDNKNDPKESLVQLQSAIDQDIRFVATSVSSVAHALSNAIAKHNERNKDKRVLLLNFNALDPALTEAKCNFWHFRFEAHSDTQVEMLTDVMRRDAGIHKVYLINQDYAYGQAVTRGAREMLGRKRPDIQIVGDDLIPLGKIKDFAPYVTKIHAADADTVFTGNWGPDLALLIKASNQAGLKANFYTLLAEQFGHSAAIGAAGADRVKSFASWHINGTDSAWEKRILQYAAKYKAGYDMSYLPPFRTLEMLATAINKNGSVDPIKVALALEGASYQGPTGESRMRTEDHQLIVPAYVVTFKQAGSPGVMHDVEGTGLGWQTDSLIPAQELVPPMKCQMQRPTE
jgi:branched-chain amino acid transport system substrate-binding protein